MGKRVKRQSGPDDIVGPAAYGKVLAEWWRARVGTYQDAALTTPAGIGDPVGGWQGTMFGSVLSAAGGTRPTLVSSTAYGGRALDFSGSNVLASAALGAGFGTLSPISLFAVVEIDVVANRDLGGVGVSGGSALVRWRTDTSSRYQVQAFDGTTSVAGATSGAIAGGGHRHFIALRWRGTTSGVIEGRIGPVAPLDGAGTLTSIAFNRFAIGGRPTLSSGSFDGRILELLLSSYRLSRNAELRIYRFFQRLYAIN